MPFGRSRRGFLLITALLVAGLVELIAHLGLWLIAGPDWKSEQAQLAKTGLEPGDRGEVEHPYFGLALEPTDSRHIPDDPVAAVNSLGLPHATEPVQPRTDEKFLIAIAGGSVARHFATLGQERLMQRLAASDKLQNREIQVICLAIEGFKQPQQLMEVSYILSLGGEFDAVVNLDGFNELVVAEGNYEVGANTTYPRSWRFATTREQAQDSSTGAFRVGRLRQERQDLANQAMTSWLRWSAVRQVLWRIQDLRLSHAEHMAAEELTARTTEAVRDFRILGPEEHFANDSALLSRLVELWADSSRQLQHLAAGEEFIYLHCLQPCAALPGTKSLSPEESRVIANSSPRLKEVVNAGYPLLREAAEQLRSDGEEFRDLTTVFQDRPETLFLDPCHLNQRGNELLADRIADELLQVLSR